MSLLLRRLAVASRRIGAASVPLRMLRPACSAYSTVATSSGKRPAKQEPKQLLLKELNKEIEEQSAVLREDLPTLAAVASEHKDYLRGSGFELLDPSADCTRVGLRKTVDGTVMTVFFDVSQVVQRGGSSNDFDDDGDDTGEDYDTSMENIELDIELCKEGKKVQLSCELDLGFEVSEDGEKEGNRNQSHTDDDSDGLVPGDSHLYITDARISHVDSSASDLYTGPEFSTLDDNLQAALTEWVQSKLGDLHALGAFIDDYAGSKEGSQYGQWLANVRAVIS